MVPVRAREYAAGRHGCRNRESGEKRCWEGFASIIRPDTGKINKAKTKTGSQSATLASRRGAGAARGHKEGP